MEAAMGRRATFELTTEEPSLCRNRQSGPYDDDFKAARAAAFGQHGITVIS